MAKSISKNNPVKNGSYSAKDEEAVASPSSIVVSEDERLKISALEGQVVRLKLALADADLQFARLEEARDDLRKKINEATKAYVDGVVETAKAHDIDLNDKSTRWNFDTNKMTFSRQE